MSLTFHYHVTMIEKSGDKRVFDLGIYNAISYDVALAKAKKDYRNLIDKFECNAFTFEVHITLDPSTKRERTKRAKREDKAIGDLVDGTSNS